jgi:hypothetical protein
MLSAYGAVVLGAALVFLLDIQFGLYLVVLGILASMVTLVLYRVTFGAAFLSTRGTRPRRIGGMLQYSSLPLALVGVFIIGWVNEGLRLGVVFLFLAAGTLVAGMILRVYDDWFYDQRRHLPTDSRSPAHVADEYPGPNPRR